MKIIPNILDLILSGITVLMTVMGIFKGFVREMLFLIFMGITFILSFIYYDHISSLVFRNLVKDATLADFLGFIAICIFLSILGLIVSFILKNKINLPSLESTDRILGGIIGCFNGICTAFIICYSISLFGLSNETIDKSLIMSFFSKILNHLVILNPTVFSSIKV